MLITCCKIKDIARELKKRKKRNSFQKFLIRCSFTSRENSLMEFKDFIYFLHNWNHIYRDSNWYYSHDTVHLTVLFLIIHVLAGWINRHNNSIHLTLHSDAMFMNILYITNQKLENIGKGINKQKLLVLFKNIQYHTNKTKMRDH